MDRENAHSNKIEQLRNYTPLEYAIEECRARIKVLEMNNHMTSQYLNEVDPTLRQKLIEVLQAEIDALSQLDPQSARDEVFEAERPFHDMADSLNPNRN